MFLACFLVSLYFKTVKMFGIKQERNKQTNKKENLLAKVADITRNDINK